MKIFKLKHDKKVNITSYEKGLKIKRRKSMVFDHTPMNPPTHPHL